MEMRLTSTLGSIIGPMKACISSEIVRGISTCEAYIFVFSWKRGGYGINYWFPTNVGRQILRKGLVSSSCCWCFCVLDSLGLIVMRF